MTPAPEWTVAEISVSDPWALAGLMTSPLSGRTTRISGDLVIVRLDHAVSIDGVPMRFVAATPRHVGIHFARNGQFPANIVFSPDEPLQDCGSTRAMIGSVAIGTMSLFEAEAS